MANVTVDTNILYRMVGITENPKMTDDSIQQLKEKHRLFITTSSLVEVIVKHKESLSGLKKCLKPIVEKELTPIHIGFMPLENKTILDIYHSSLLSEVSGNIALLLKQKIDKEAELLRFFLTLTFVGVFHSIREEMNYKFDDQRTDQIFLASTKMLLETAVSVILEEIQMKLGKAYSEGRQQKFTSEEIPGIFQRCLFFWIYNFYLAKHSILEGDLKNPNKEKLENITQEMETDEFRDLFKKCQNNPFSIIRKKRFRKYIEDYQSDLATELEKHGLITDEVLEYILLSAENTFIKGSRIEKNNTFDLLLLYCLHIEDMNLITLDKNLSKLLRTIHESSYQIMDELCITYD